MNEVSDGIEQFFEKFNQANNSFDPELLGALISDPLLGADPNGVTQVVEKDAHLASIGERESYLRSLGFRSVNVIPLEEIPLGADYVMVKTHGTMRLESDSGEPKALVHDAAYILFVGEGSQKIVFALSHEDPREMMQEQAV